MNLKKLGLVLFVVSFVPWLSAFAVPFLPLSIAQKSLLAPLLFVVGEVLFWVSLAILGKESAERYRRWFNPRFLGRKLKRVWRQFL
ncbi:MAG TPA: transporter suffix domain-containing protein [Thermosynechococcaceae cyanobacterium]